jgi:hypothetical protein
MKVSRVASLALVVFVLLAPQLIHARARAAVPADYKGKPFDPAMAGGGTVIPTTVKAGPYAIPGRLDLINYDFGGEGVAYTSTHHEVKNGTGYRTDGVTATFSLTAASKPDLWYGTGTAMDGTAYPSATTADFYVGALDMGDWFDYTVDVKTAGTYSVSSTWATGNGPAGGQGGDGSMGLQIFVNGTMMADWKAAFPDYQTKANYHFWKPYPSFATITLEAGLQVLKLQCTSNHQNLDYLQIELVGADAGAPADAAAPVDAGAAGGASGSGGGAAGASGGAAGQGGGAGSVGSSGAAGATSTGTAGMNGAAGQGAAGGAGSVGSAGAAGAAAGAGGAGSSTAGAGAPKSGGGCAVGSGSPRDSALLVLLLGAILLARRRAKV